jgi:transposase
MSDLESLYEADYAAWARRHVDLLRAGRFSEMDVEHLSQELSDMGKSERRELESRLLTLLAHLLKWEHQDLALSERWREFKGDSWRETIVEQRKQLAVLLRQSPGLKPIVAETIAAAYPDAADLAGKEGHLPPETFPAQCPYSAEQLLQDDFYPGASGTRS